MGMRLNVTVGDIGGNLVSVRRCEDGNINIIVSQQNYKAIYQRTQTGLLQLHSTYPREVYTTMYNALLDNLVEIDRRCIELSEAELRIPYHAVTTDNGNKISVGQSNSLIVYIVLENYEYRAIFNFNGSKVQFIRSTYPPEDGVMLTEIVKRNMPQILKVMERYNMIERTDAGANNTHRLYKERFSSTMTETGKEERTHVDKVLTNLFEDLDNRGYSNLEIQSMLLESVFEIALQFRTKADEDANRI
jgi:hypothetical protein